ncbi:sugar-binding transcriptional regulator [Lacticaseibacillus sp. N501-2]|uniref:sugar-binding transcriptional regulator n=1 Tax=Lacticaseibacillus salsurae TaxID=3367729 RepID=UPI0038B3D913
MQEVEKIHLMAKAAYLYYVDDRTQSQVATMLQVDRSTVSRLLKRARDTGIVTIQVHHFDVATYQLEQQLQQRFGLNDAIVIPTDPNADSATKNQQLAKTAAQYLKRIIAPRQKIGFAWGTTLSGMVGQLDHPIKTNATFVPLVGGPSSANAKYHVNGIVYDAARQFGGESLFIDAAAVQESKMIRDGIWQSQYFQTIRQIWNHLDIAFVGIGGALNRGTSRWRDLLSAEDIAALQDREVIGDCCCTFFDRHGRVLKGALHDRTIAIDLKQLKQTPNTVGVVRSLTKAPAIKTFLTMGVLNTLITDSETAQRILS